MTFRLRLMGVVTALAAGAICNLVNIAPAEAQRRPGPAAAAQWVKLGEQRVGFNVDRDTIEVGRQEGSFRALKLVVRGADIFVIDMKVTFGNGETQDLVVNAAIRANTETRPLDLQGDGRFIQRVDFIYRARQGFSGRATVELQGLADAPRGGPGFAGPPGPPPSRVYAGEVPKGYVLFGTQTVGFQNEKDVIRLGRDVGRFGKIALRVTRNDIFLREVIVNMSRGETQRLPINAEIQANGVTQPIDIRDGRIESIELVYQARPGFRGQAVVEVYGEHAERWVGDQGGGRGQWILLGAQRAERFGNDRDVYQVGRRLGAFRQLKVRAQGHAVTLQAMRVNYSNGESEDLPVPRDLRGGQETPPIDLRGRDRYIETIELQYRTRFNLKGDATVEVHGLH